MVVLNTFSLSFITYLIFYIFVGLPILGRYLPSLLSFSSLLSFPPLLCMTYRCIAMQRLPPYMAGLLVTLVVAIIWCFFRLTTKHS